MASAVRGVAAFSPLGRRGAGLLLEFKGPRAAMRPQKAAASAYGPLGSRVVRRRAMVCEAQETTIQVVPSIGFRQSLHGLGPFLTASFPLHGTPFFVLLLQLRNRTA